MASKLLEHNYFAEYLWSLLFLLLASSGTYTYCSPRFIRYFCTTERLTTSIDITCPSSFTRSTRVTKRETTEHFAISLWFAPGSFETHITSFGGSVPLAMG